MSFKLPRRVARFVVLRLDDVHRTYVGSGGDVHALRGVDLVVEEGEFVVVTGASGAGKSTLLHVAGLLDAPTRGRVTFAGQDARAWSERERAAARLRGIGFVFQHHDLMPDLTVHDNVALPALARGYDAAAAHARADALLARVGMAHASTRLPRELSGGEQQRVGVARALVNAPRMVLADEPTGDLDPSNADAVAALLAQVHREGATVLVVTHDPERFPAATRRVRLDAGRVVSP